MTLPGLANELPLGPPRRKKVAAAGPLAQLAAPAGRAPSMTAKVGESRSPLASAVVLTEYKYTNLLKFISVLQRASGAPAMGPEAFDWRGTASTSEAALEGVGRFTRSGMGLASEAEGVPGTPIDPLELSLSRTPTSLRIEAAQRVTAMDVADVAVLERVVERLSFGGDRRGAIARLQLGGIWAGAVLVVRASGNEVELQLEGSMARPETRELGERLVARLRLRGFSAALRVS